MSLCCMFVFSILVYTLCLLLFLRHVGAGAAPAKAATKRRRVAPRVAALARGFGRAQSAGSRATTASRGSRGAARASLGGRVRRGALS